MEQEVNDGKANGEFVQTVVPESSSPLKRQDIMCIRKLQNIAREERLFVDNGTSYEFLRTHRARATQCAQEKKK